MKATRSEIHKLRKMKDTGNFNHTHLPEAKLTEYMDILGKRKQHIIDTIDRLYHTIFKKVSAVANVDDE